MSESLITKKAIAAGLKELVRKKSFQKITIQDITKSCGLNRQTFYYHFQDKYELVDWIYYNEAIAIIIDNLTFENWDSKVLEMLKKMKSEDYFYRDTLKAISENGFSEYLFQIVCELFLDIVNRIIDFDRKEKTFVSESKALSKEKYGKQERQFIAEFYAFGIVGVVNAWVEKGMKESPEYITEQLKNVSEGTQKFAAARFWENSEN